MSDDATVSTDSSGADDVGERRRALQAERRRADRRRDEPPPPPSTLVRPYARVASPSAAIPIAQVPPAGPVSPVAAVAAAPDGDPVADLEPDSELEPDAEPVAESVIAPAEAEPPVTDQSSDDESFETQSYEDQLFEEQPLEAELDPSELLEPAFAGVPAAAGSAGDQPDEVGAPEPAPTFWSPPPLPSPAPEMAPPGWSAFTPVIPPEPPGYEGGPDASGDLPESVEEPVDDPVEPEPASWQALSDRSDDDDAWLRGLRDPVADQPVVDQAPQAFSEPEPEPFGQGHPDVVAAGATLTPSAGHRAFGRAPAQRLSQALSRSPEEPGAADPEAPRRPADPSSAADPAPARSEEDEEPLRGTLAPVLRHSTERAKAGPVLRPAVGPATQDAVAVSLTWDEALSGTVVPHKGGRTARPRHESGGAGEYRPRGAPDRSLTLLVVGMLLVLALLVGVAIWAIWPRVVGARSLPRMSAGAPLTIART